MRVRPWTLSSPTSLVVDIKESTTHAANLVVLPSRLTLHLPCVLVCLPLFGCLLAICVVSLPPPKKKINVYPTGVLPTPHSSHLTTLSLNPILPNPLLPNPYCAPYTQPLGSTPVTHPPCHALSKPFSPLYPIITPTLHDHPRTNLVPWKIALNRSARAVFAEWEQFGFLFGVCDDPVWAVLNTPRCGPDHIFRPQLPLPPEMVLLSVTPSNAPRTPGQLGWQSQLLSVQRSWIA